MWNGNYSNWQEAKVKCSGYDSSIILEKCKKALLKVKNGEALYERDSVVFDKIQYSWGLLAGLQKAAIENNNKLCVIDFGGSLGSTYYQNKDFLNGLNIEWLIVEQKHFVDCGKEFFEDQILKFYHTIDECFLNHKPNVLVLSSVLQYLENPQEWINLFLKKNFEYIILDRTAFAASENDFITIQTVPESIYFATYPTWFFNKQKLIDKFVNYTVVAETYNNFTNDFVINNCLGTWSGLILKLNKE